MVAIRVLLLLLMLLTPLAAQADQCTETVDEMVADARAALREIQDKTKPRSSCEIQTMAYEHHMRQFQILSRVFAACPPEVWVYRKCKVECMTAEANLLQKLRHEACEKK
jgi:hypothetical protein